MTDPGREPVDYQCGYCTHISRDDREYEEHFESAHPEYYYAAEAFYEEHRNGE